MKRGRTTSWRVDWTHSWPPAAGQVVKRLTATNQDGGYWRITGVRQINVRTRLPYGYTGRWSVHVEYIGDRYDDPVAWTCHAWGKRNPAPPPAQPFPKPKDISEDRFSPLLPPGEEE